MRAMFILALLLSALTLSACSKGGIPTDKPLVTGKVTQMQNGRILVEEKPGQPSGDMKCWFAVTTKSGLFRQEGKLVERAKSGDLAVGQLVSIWAVGPIRESYPCQADAGTVLILGAGAQ